MKIDCYLMKRILLKMRVSVIVELVRVVDIYAKEARK